MAYKEFTELIRDKIAETLGEDFEVSLVPAVKNNGVKLIGLVIKGDSNISPIIYLENFYDEYKDGRDTQEIEHEILRAYSEHSEVKGCFEPKLFYDWNWIKDRVCFKLVSKEKNKKFLQSVPHRPFLDLAMVYYVPLDMTISGFSSTVVYNEHLEMWGKSERSLNMRAKVNTAKAMPSAYWGISEILGMPDIEDHMYVVSNENRINGASVMVYSDKFSELADKLDSDLIVIPSSVHQVLVISSRDFNDIDYIKSMIEQINHDFVADDEILSDSVYKYSRESGSMKVVA